MRAHLLTALWLLTACSRGGTGSDIQPRGDGGGASGAGGSTPSGPAGSPGGGGGAAGAAGSGGGPGPADAGDAGSPRPDAADTSGPRPDAADASSPRPDAADAGSPRPDAAEAGSPRPDAAEAGSPRPDAAETGVMSGSECRGPKARAGESCRNDFDCDAGLLCDEGNLSCRPIAGLRLLTSFNPAGRTDGYSEGLDVAHGSLWQATPDQLLRIDPIRRAVVATYPPPTDYAESLSWNGNVLYNVSFRNGNLYASEAVNNQLMFKLVGALQMTGGCVYGIVDHCDELYVTRCGRSVVDVYATGTTTPIRRTFTVRDRAGVALPEIEDLEIYRGQLWTSTFRSTTHRRTLFRVDMTTNQAVDAYTIPCSTLAIDGVAADPATRTLYVTGKDCPIFVYRVE